MATRKRLSDLLREEVNRPEDEGDAPAETPPTPSTSRTSRTKAKSAGQPATSRSQAAAAKPVAPEPEPPTEPNEKGETDALKASLADLQTQLEESRAQEGILKRQVDALQTDLHDRDATVQRLQADLRDLEQLRTELEEAKQMIRGLTEQHQAEVTARKAAPPPPAPPAAPEPAAEAPAGALRRQVQVHATTELWRVLQHPVAVEIPSTQLTNDDIGWVD